MAEGQALFDAVQVSRMDSGRAGEVAAALGVLGLEQVPLAGTRAQDFTAGGNLETLGGGLFGFDAFRTSHK